MILLGVLLLVLAVVAGALLFAGTASITDTVDVDVLGGTLALQPVVLLVTGMVVITIFWLGWALLRVGVRRSRRRRQDAKEAARVAEEERLAEEQRMKQEVAAREQQLEEERRRHEEREAELRREAEQRVAEQHQSTETARRRAEVAEARTGTPVAGTSPHPATSAPEGSPPEGSAPGGPERPSR